MLWDEIWINYVTSFLDFLQFLVKFLFAFLLIPYFSSSDTVTCVQKEKRQSTDLHHLCCDCVFVHLVYRTSSGQAVDSGCLMRRFRLWCGEPPSCVCQRQFGLIYKLLTHSALDPSSAAAAGMAIPCVGGRSTWVVLSWMRVRCGFSHKLQQLRGTCPADSVEKKKKAFRKCGPEFWFYSS